MDALGYNPSARRRVQPQRKEKGTTPAQGEGYNARARSERTGVQPQREEKGTTPARGVEPLTRASRGLSPKGERQRSRRFGTWASRNNKERGNSGPLAPLGERVRERGTSSEGKEQPPAFAGAGSEGLNYEERIS